MATQVVTGSDQYVGDEQLASLATAKPLASIPTGTNTPNYAIIQAVTKDIRIRGGSSVPTAALGFVVAAGSSIKWTAELSGVRIIETAASAEGNVMYFKTGVAP